MSGGAHRIRSLCWQVAAGSSAEGFAWRSLLRAHGTSLVLPALAEGLDAAVPEHQVIRIPRLRVRLRLRSTEELAAVLPEAIRSQLPQQVIGRCREQLAAGEDDAAAEPVLTRDNGQGAADPSPAEEHEVRSLFQYLRTGTLPWEAAIGPVAAQTAVLDAIRRQWWPQVVAHLRRQREGFPFFFRLLHLIPEADNAPPLADLAGLVASGTERAAVTECLTVMREAATGFSRHARLSLVAALLAELAGRDGFSPGRFVLAKVAAAAVLPGEWRQLERFIAGLPQRAAALFSPAGEGDGADDLLLGMEDGQPASAPVSAPCQTFPDQPAAEKRRRGGRMAAAGEGQRSAATGTQRELAAGLFPLRIAQAGLVLLHPYLGRLLEYRGLKDPAHGALFPLALPRIAALLHFLATGRDEVLEFELGLVKILLGCDPLTPLAVCEGLLTGADKDEAEALLAAVIGHWSALKNTSVPGLRTAFVERPGLLRAIEGGWRLNVERQPHDILLERLPWSISLVRLPWMDRPLFVEW